ncbi:tRNA 2-thiouridine(34) synthase MnmA, partial [Gammaproteobacteria bacterium]|nr:tRNA 2-thiouridine(34) synthase MnmA [Gammaproteobacteria bacterium]
MNNGLNLEQVNWINNINYEFPLNCSVQIRHQHKPVNCKLVHENDLFKTIFSE